MKKALEEINISLGKSRNRKGNSQKQMGLKSASGRSPFSKRKPRAQKSSRSPQKRQKRQVFMENWRCESVEVPQKIYSGGLPERSRERVGDLACVYIQFHACLHSKHSV